MRSISAENRRVALLREFEGSGLSMAEFCRRREVGYSTMAAWRRACRPCPQQGVFVEVEPVLTDDGGSSATTATPAAAVAAAACCNDSPRHPMAELMLPGGAVLRLYQITSTGGRA